MADSYIVTNPRYITKDNPKGERVITRTRGGYEERDSSGKAVKFIDVSRGGKIVGIETKTPAEEKKLDEISASDKLQSSLPSSRMSSEKIKEAAAKQKVKTFESEPRYNSRYVFPSFVSRETKDNVTIVNARLVERKDKDVVDTRIKYSEVGNNGSSINDNRNNILATSNNSLIKETGFEKEISFASRWEEAIGKRSSGVYELFRGKSDDSYIQTLGREYGLALPSRLVTEYPERIGLAGYKGYLNVKGLIQKDTRSNVAAASLSALKSVPKAVASSFDIRTPQGLGNVITFVSVPSLLKQSGAVVSKASTIGRTFEEPSTVFSSQVLVEGKTFPTASSVSESLIKFKSSTADGGLVASSATTARIPKSTVVKAGGAAAANLEDVGLYITPKGEGSPYFLRVGEGKYYDVTLNPLAAFKSPKVLEVKYSGISTLPKPLLSNIGFRESNLFLKEQGLKATGVAYITKRSTAGFGEIPLRNVGFSATTELEAVIPVGTPLKFVKGSRFTKYKGFNVPINEYTVSGVGDLSSSIVGKSFLKKYARSSSSLAGRESISIFPLSSYLSYKTPTLTGLSSSQRYADYSSLIGYSFKGASYNVGSSKVTSSLKYNNYGSSGGLSAQSYKLPSYNILDSSRNYPSIKNSLSSKLSKKLRLPDMNFGKKKVFKFKRQGLFKSRYNPSVEAGLFKIKAKRVNLRLANTGLVLRPILAR